MLEQLLFSTELTRLTFPRREHPISDILRPMMSGSPLVTCVRRKRRFAGQEGRLRFTSTRELNTGSLKKIGPLSTIATRQILLGRGLYSSSTANCDNPPGEKDCHWLPVSLPSISAK